tara:strand:+ start:1410 stop:1607 length:198 start_codon:yes stop_codon:yes gene_type:complete
MVIFSKKNKQSNLESVKQISFFGYDNLDFKTINLPKSLKYNKLCKSFRLKKIVKNKIILLNLINL